MVKYALFYLLYGFPLPFAQIASSSFRDIKPPRSPTVREIPTHYSPYPHLIAPLQQHASTVSGWEFFRLNYGISEADLKHAGSRVQAGMGKTWI